MTKFKTREEYESWKATRNSRMTPSAKNTSAIAGRKPRLWLVIAGATVLASSSVFLFATGDPLSGLFVLALGALNVGFYVYFKMHPHMDNADYLKTVTLALVRTALHQGRVSQQDIEAVKLAEKKARERYASVQDEKK